MKERYLIIILSLLIISSCNPFAPSLSDDNSLSGVISEQKTVDGVFDNFKYAYTFKDTLVYGKLLDEDFLFTYVNYDRGDNPSWGRATDMQKTYKLFQAAYKIELTWNDTWSQVEYNKGDTLLVNVNRRFILTVYYSPTLSDYVYGNAFFRLRRLSVDVPWKIIHWDDQSV